MKNETKPIRFTLSLPEKIHLELTKVAKESEMSSKEVIIKSLKLGFIAFNFESDSSKELILREKVDGGKTKETRLIFI